jgi:hypothetical protein
MSAGKERRDPRRLRRSKRQLAGDASRSRAVGAVAGQVSQAAASFVLQVLAVRILGLAGFRVFALLYGLIILGSAIITGLVGNSHGARSFLAPHLLLDHPTAAASPRRSPLRGDRGHAAVAHPRFPRHSRTKRTARSRNSSGCTPRSSHGPHPPCMPRASGGTRGGSLGREIGRFVFAVPENQRSLSQ